MKFIITATVILYSLCSVGQETSIAPNELTSRQTFFDDLQYQRVPDLIVKSWGKLKGKTERKVVYDNPALRAPKESVTYIYNSKVKTGYLHINQTIEKTMDSEDMRKVEYYLNDEIVDEYKLVKKLFKLKKNCIQSLEINKASNLEFVKVHILLND